MGDKQRYQPQYDRDRGRDDRDEQGVRPREWPPSEDYRRDEHRQEGYQGYRRDGDQRERYASYYNDRQFGTRGRDEREQGSRYAAEEQCRPSSFGASYSPSEQCYRSSQQRQAPRNWGTRYLADKDDYSDREEEHESFGQQLREAGHKIARSIERAFRFVGHLRHVREARRVDRHEVEEPRAVE